MHPTAQYSGLTWS